MHKEYENRIQGSLSGDQCLEPCKQMWGKRVNGNAKITKSEHAGCRWSGKKSKKHNCSGNWESDDLTECTEKEKKVLCFSNNSIISIQ